MKVAELKKVLSEVPDDLPVMIELPGKDGWVTAKWIFESRGERQIGNDQKVFDSRHLVLAEGVNAHHAHETVTTDGAAFVIEASY